MTITRTHAIATFVCILGLASSVAHADTPDATEPVQAVALVAPDADAVATILRELPARFDNCSIVSGPTGYDSAALAEQLGDEAADLSAYGHEWTVRATYAMPVGGPQVTVEIHRMRREMAAYGVFAGRRKPSAQLPEPFIRTSSYWLNARLHVWRGDFYIHAYAATDDVVLRAQVRAVAEAPLASIPVPERLPALLRILPCRGRQMPVPRYHYGAAPGFSFPADAVGVTYLEGFEQYCSFLFARCGDFNAATTAYDQLVAELYDGADALEPLGQIADHKATICTTAEGTAAVMQQDNFVAAVFDSHNPEFAEAVLRMSAINIRIHLLID